MGRSSILAAGGALLLSLSVAGPVAAGPIVGEWDPGLTEAEVGGPLVVDGYGVHGLGVHQVQLADGPTRPAVCVQADVGHSRAADYAVDGGSPFAAELGYLTWAYLAAGSPTDAEAAAINVLAWRYTDAQRRTGGPVWQGDDVEVRALGVGRLTDVEDAVRRLHDEATARRGPWGFTDPVVTEGTAAIGIAGPGGPIAGVPVTFAGGAWSVVAVSGPDGRASAAVPPDVASITATATGPGGAVALVAAGSQRLAMAGPPNVLTASAAVPPPTTTTTPPPTTTTTAPPPPPPPPSSTTTTPPPTTTTTPPPPPPPPSTTTTTVLPATTTTPPPPSTTTNTATTTTTTTTTTVPIEPTTTTTSPPPPTTVVSPPTLPRTGGSSRGLVRVGSVLFAGGAGAVLLAAPRRKARCDER